MSSIKELDILRSMAYMHDAGMSMHEIIYELSGTVKDKRLSQRLDGVDDLMKNQGRKFTDALESVGLFGEYIPILRTGEQTGKLGKVMQDIITTASKIEALNKKVKTMTVYPIILMFVSIGLGYGISLLLLKILTTLPEKDVKGTTAYAVAHFIATYRLIIFPMYAVLLAAGLWFIAKNASRIPIVNRLFNIVTVGQAFKLIALCVDCGMPLKDTFILVSQVINEKRWQQLMSMLASESVQRNIYNLVDELSDFISTPDLLIIKSNIKAGDMSKGFDFVGDRKIEDSYTMIERLSPVIQVVTFFFVAVQVMAIMTPLYALLIGYASKQ
jgi:type II secretory pathway component PulF